VIVRKRRIAVGWLIEGWAYCWLEEEEVVVEEMKSRCSVASPDTYTYSIVLFYDQSLAFLHFNSFVFNCLKANGGLYS
jgi:hypothetical protein